MAFSVSYIYQIRDQYSSVLKKINRQTSVFKKNISDTQRRTKALSNKMANLQGIMSTVVGVGAILFPVKRAMEFESAMADVAKVTNLTPKQFEALKEQIKSASKEMGRLPVQTAAIVEAAGRLNIPVDQLKKFTAITTRASVAFGVMESEIGNSIASLKSKLGLSVDGVENLLDAINYLADNTSAQGDRMIEIIGRMSGVMGSINMPSEFIAGWAAFADQIEVTPELAASGMRMMISKMKTYPAMLKSLLTDPNKTIIDVLTQLKKLDPIKRAQEIQKTFGVMEGKFVEMAVNKIDLLGSTLEKVTDKSKYTGSMLKELAYKMKTAAFQTSKWKSALIVLSIEIGNTLLPVIKEVAPKLTKITESITKFVKAHPTITKIVIAITALVAAIGAIVIVVAVLSAGFSFLLSFLSGLIAAFTALIATIGVLISILGAPMVAIYAIGFALLFLENKFGLVTKGIALLKEKFKSLQEVVIETFAHLKSKALEFIQPLIDLIDRLIEIKDRLTPSFLKSEESISVQREIMSKGTLDGQINISADKGLNIMSSEFNTDMPGNLGLNMGY
ncbi:MAG: phage tail tape measure protein [Bacteroidetes bacterium]|nr:phage tail tape measure protein [Bacteroidota bacterium]